ncbi:UNVERIFIED_CONTAM: hypothetical protein PYX00_004426 [Menopon gallinae]|uniref:Cytochrome P450 n=1 Tax=Menopon gallinae TaxID=328185 RepID=A0AAW2I3N1_9NEOP
MAVVIISNLSYLLFGLVVAAIGFIRFLKSRGTGEAPGPFAWPVIGSLHLLRGYKVPYQAFNHLAKKYGDVFSLQMGSVPAVVVQGVDNIRQVLIQKGHHFDSRPNFGRYHQLFHGNKENSLAFCNWSDLQKKRRDMLKDHTFPKVYMENYKHLDRLICEEFGSKPRSASHVSGASVDIKEKLALVIGNIFLRYFCSTDLKDDSELADFVRNFDEIFYEVNQGYAFDFLPFLSVFHRRQIGKIQNNSENIRRFVLEKVVAGRLQGMKEDAVETDYLDTLLKAVKFPSEEEVTIDLETALFSLEDIIGGHSAISNFLVKLVQYLASNGDVQAKVKEEADRLRKDFISLDDRCKMPYTEAVVMETLRLLSSPIVPHVANQDTSISGYAVKKDTLIFLNNYELNMSEELWSNPAAFDPSRFIDPETGAKTKPTHFLPFGGGKRSCMGYKLVQFLSFVFVANIVNNFSITPAAGEKCEEVSTGNLALPPTRPYRFEFHVRTK